MLLAAKPVAFGGAGAVPPPPRIVLGCNGGYIATSDDNGASFTQRKAVGSGQVIRDLGWNGVMMIGANINGVIDKSTDGGLNWTQQTVRAGSTVWTSVRWDGSLWWLIGVDTNTVRLYTSPDGNNWTERTSPGTSVLSNPRFAFGQGVVVTSGGNIGTTSTSGRASHGTIAGLSLTALSGFGYAMHDVAFGNGVFVGVGALGSTNRAGAFVAAPANVGSVGNWTTVDFGAGTFYAFTVGFDGSQFFSFRNVNEIGFSSNGTSWSGWTSTGLGGTAARSCAFRNGRYFLANQNTTLQYNTTPGSLSGWSGTTVAQAIFSILA